VHRPVIEGRQSGITEFPITRVGCAGKTLGLCVRLFPAWFLRRRIPRPVTTVAQFQSAPFPSVMIEAPG
jgi:hypothetical protein